jgi:YD repeat-containing protein
MTYDVADRHMSTTLDDGTVITYQRDAAGTVVSRTVDTPTEAPETIRYTSVVPSPGCWTAPIS